ncbi:MAG TPA: four helix bundle protein [Candidatus Hydrogenedentes bacterium]|nr:four helix bundle protein [Candidatus Hydrogenedentota bacterium]
MDREDFKKRTQAFALRIIRLVESLPDSRTSMVLGKQLLRSGTSVGANYRAACRARSTADFIAKMGIVEEEADECIYWLDLLVQSEQIKPALVDSLRNEANEILAMVIASIKTARSRK